MSPRSKALTALVLGVAGMAATLTAERVFAPVVTPLQLAQDPERYHGRVVKVRGWMTECGDLDCGLFNSPQDAQFMTKLRAGDLAAILQNDRDRRGLLKKMRFVTIGESRWDDLLRRYRHRWIVVTGRFDATCYHRDVICFDRSRNIAPLRWTAPYLADAASKAPNDTASLHPIARIFA